MRLLSKPKISRRQLWIRRLLLIGLVVVAFGVWRGYGPVKQRYQVYKQQKALERARDFMGKNDLKAAKLEIEIAIAAVPGTPDAVRAAADLLDKAGAPQALVLRRRLVEMPNATVPDRLALSATALRQRDFNTAREALAGLPAEMADKPEVLRAYLAYALAADARPVADALLDRLQQTGQADERSQVVHAMLRRLHPNAEKSSAARAELEKLAENPDYQLVIRRSLFSDAIARRDMVEARRQADLAAASTGANFADQLNQANLSLLADKQPFETVFASVAPTAAKSGENAAEFVRWLLVQGKGAEATAWLDKQAPEITASPAVLQARSDLAVAAQDWKGLASLLEAGAWGKLPPKFMLRVMEAHAKADDPEARKLAWKAVLTAAGTDRRARETLLRLTTVWRWSDEYEQLLWATIEGDPTQNWAHERLMTVYRGRGDAAKMLAVLTVLKNGIPGSTDYLNDWTLLTLLTAPSNKWDATKDGAKALALRDLDNPTYLTTYALALAQVGKVGEARRTIEKMPAAQRDFPPRAPYLAYIYGLCRMPAEFDRYAALARQVQLLREERRLLAIGEISLGRNPPAGEAGALVPTP
jgi:hypothetical protein